MARKKKEEQVEVSEEGKVEETNQSEDKKEEVEETVMDGQSVQDESPEKVRLFNRWSFRGLEVNDESLEGYINLKPIIIPHSSGKHSRKKFWKSERISVIERFVNKMLSPGLLSKRIKGRGASQYMGKKQKALRILYNAFTIIEAKTGKNPIQALVDSIINVAPREETTRISMGGVSYQQAVDIAPQRRVDLAIKLILQSVAGLAYNGLKTIDEIIAEELILASRNDVNSRSIKRKDELERIAIGAR